MNTTPHQHPCLCPSINQSVQAIKKCACGFLLLLCYTLYLQASPIPPTDNASQPYMALFGWGLTSSGINHDAYTASWLNRSGFWAEDACAYSGSTQSLAWATLAMPGVVTAGAKAWVRQNPNGMELISMGMFPTGYTPGDNYSTSISGTYSTSWYKTAAQNLVNAGLTSGTSGTFNHVIVRLGWEFNGGWYPWHVTHTNTQTDTNGNLYDDRPANFVALWQKIVTTMRSVAPNLQFCWNGANSWSAYAISDAYPGDTYVDYVGVDAYDQSWATNSYPYTTGTYPYGSDASTRQQNAWNNWIYPTGQDGIVSWKNIAVAHSKPFSFPEWGCVSRTDGHGGLDNPYFVQQMYNFIRDPANNVAFHCYFDVQAGDGHHQLTTLPGGTPSEFPHAAALFQQLFGVPPFPTDADIGTVGVSGSSNVVTVYGAGTGCLVGGTSDNLHLSARPITGDDMVVVQVTSMTSGSTTQSGVMLRQSTAANSPYAALFLSNGNCVFQSRDTTGAAAVVDATTGSITAPVWLKLARSGNVVTGWESSDGINWTLAGSQTVVMSGTVNLGVAVSSGNTTSLNTTGINNVDQVNIDTAQTANITGAVVLDNTSSTGVTISGTWTTRTSPSGFYGTNYIDDANKNKGACSITFTPTLPASGQYDVYATWTGSINAGLGGFGIHADNVPISVVSSSGTTQLVANQCVGTNLWNYLGSYSFASGTTGSVAISNAGTDGYTLADGVMFVPVPTAPTPIILDNSDSSGVTISGAWVASTSIPGYWGANYIYANGGTSVTYTPTIPISGTYHVYARWTAYTNRATNVPITINSASGQTVVTVNQQQNGGVWVLLGDYSFNAGTSGSIVVGTSGANGVVVADAVQLIKQ